MTTRERLQALADLEPGWLDGEGLPIAEEVIAWAADVLEAAEGKGMPAPHIFPSPCGGIQAEWSFGRVEVSAFFDMDVKVIDCLRVFCHAPSSTEVYSEGELDCEEEITGDGAAERVAAFVLASMAVSP